MKILFVGAINENSKPLGGEEYKNQILIKKLKIDFKNCQIIDTFQWNKRVNIWISLLKNCFFNSYDTILISASSFSTYKLLLLLYFFKPTALKKIIYLVIGGYLPEGLRTGKFKKFVYTPLKFIIVEGHWLRVEIQNTVRINNIVVLPNFKEFNPISINYNTRDEIFKFVYVGRITTTKGIDRILEALEILKSQKYKCLVDFYGNIENHEYRELLRDSHKGFLDFTNNNLDSYVKLSEYDCMLFPTYWQGEGFPGVILDAFVSGLPVIATNWNMNNELIEHKINGLIIEPKSTMQLVEAMKYSIDNRGFMIEIGKRNQLRSKEYHIDIVWPKIHECVLR